MHVLLIAGKPTGNLLLLPCAGVTALQVSMMSPTVESHNAK